MEEFVSNEHPNDYKLTHGTMHVGMATGMFRFSTRALLHHYKIFEGSKGAGRRYK